MEPPFLLCEFIFRPATGAFLVKSDALCEAGGESYFYSYFRRLQKAAENRGFFLRLTAQVVVFYMFAGFLKPAKRLLFSDFLW